MPGVKRYRLDVWSEDGSTRQGTIFTRDLISAKVKREVNAEYGLDFETPIDAAPGENGLLNSRWMIYVFDLDEENDVGYLPRKFRMQRIQRQQAENGQMIFKVGCEHITFDMLSEVIPEETTYANLTADLLLTEILKESTAFTKDTTGDFLQNFYLDSFTIGGANRLDNLRSLAEAVDGELVVTDDFKVNIIEHKDPAVDAAEVRVTPRYNLLALEEESDSRRLVTRMFGIGGGDPRLTLAGTWHPCAQAYNSIAGVAIHKFAPNDDAFEPLDAGTASVKRYFLEFRAQLGTYFGIKKFVARGALFGGGADFIEVEIEDLAQLVAWTVVFDKLNGNGDFCRLWYDSESDFTAGWEAQGAGPPTMNPQAVALAAPAPIKTMFDSIDLGVATTNDWNNWISMVLRDTGQGVYAVNDIRGFHYWETGRALTDWSALRNESQPRTCKTAAAFHPTQGLFVLGYNVIQTQRGGRIPVVDHYTVDAGSDEVSIGEPWPGDKPSGIDTGYEEDICLIGDKVVAVQLNDHASAPYATRGVVQRSDYGPLSGTPSWSDQGYVSNDPDSTDPWIPETDASHPGGAGLEPELVDVWARTDNENGGGLHLLFRGRYIDGTNEWGHVWYQYENNAWEEIVELRTQRHLGTHRGTPHMAIPRNNPEAVSIAFWEWIDRGTDLNDFRLVIVRRSGTPGQAGTWTREVVYEELNVSDTNASAYGLATKTDLGEAGTSESNMNADYAYDLEGNEHLVYCRRDGTGNTKFNVFYRSKDNTATTPTWTSETKVSTGSTWDAHYDSGADTKIFKLAMATYNGWFMSSAGSEFRVIWLGRTGIANTYKVFVGGAQFGDDPGAGDGTVSFNADVILLPLGGYDVDCAGNELPLKRVDWIEERDTTNVPATKGYELHGWVDGLVEEGSLEFTENLFDDAFLSRLVAYTGGRHTLINDIGNGTPTFTKNTDGTYIKNGDVNQKVVTTAQNEGCYIDFDFGLPSNCSDYFSIRVLIYLEAGEVQLDVSEGDRDTWANRGTQTIFPTGANENAVKVTRTGFVEIQFNGLEARGGNDGRLWFYQPGATGATYYIDSIQIEPKANVSDEWVETSTKRLLWSKVYDELVKVNGVKKIYTVKMRDLYVEGLNPYDVFEPGGIIEVENEELGVSKTKLRVVRKDEDLLDPGGTDLNVASRLERHQDHTASLYTRINDRVDANVRSIRKQIKERLRLGPPKVGIVVRPDETENMDLRTQILTGDDDPYP